MKSGSSVHMMGRKWSERKLASILDRRDWRRDLSVLDLRRVVPIDATVNWRRRKAMMKRICWALLIALAWLAYGVFGEG